MWLFSVCLQCCASDRVCPFSFYLNQVTLGIARSIETITEFLRGIEKWETISKTGRALQSLQTEEESVIAAWEKIVLQTRSSYLQFQHELRFI